MIHRKILSIRPSVFVSSLDIFVFSVCKLKRLFLGPADMFRNHSYFNIVLRSLYRFLQVIHIHWKVSHKSSKRDLIIAALNYGHAWSFKEHIKSFCFKPHYYTRFLWYRDFFLWKPSLKSVMFTLLCIALWLPDTFRGVSRAVENGKTRTRS